MKEIKGVEGPDGLTRGPWASSRWHFFDNKSLTKSGSPFDEALEVDCRPSGE
jgi:hypothetical protein